MNQNYHRIFTENIYIRNVFIIIGKKNEIKNATYFSL